MNQESEMHLEEARVPVTRGPEPRPQPLILVPIQDARLGRAAVAVARTASRIMGGEVHVLGITDEIVPDRELLQRIGLQPEMVVGAVVEQATGPIGAAVGRVANSESCSMIVLAEWRRRVDSDCEMQPDIEEVLSQTTCPALVVPVDDETAAMRTGRAMQRVLLPLDGTPDTAAAIRPAVDLAYAAGAEVVAIHVVTPGQERPKEPGTLSAPRYIDHPEHDWPAWSHEFIARFLSCVAECPVQPKAQVFLRTGDFVDEVLRFSEEDSYSVIAMTWRGKFEPGHPSTVKKVLCRSKYPVLITHAEAPPPEAWRQCPHNPQLQ